MARETPRDSRGNRLSHGERTFLLGVVVLALAVRLVYHIEMRGNVLVEQLQLDELFHHQWAQSIAAGDVVGEDVFFRAPLYPYAVGLLYAVFGSVPELVRVLQHIVGAGLVILLYLLARTLFGIRAAVVASLLGALYAVLIFFEGRLLFDFSVTSLAFLWLALVVFISDKPAAGWPWFALVGLLFGLVCIMRPPFLAIAIPLFGYILWSHRRGERRTNVPAVALVSGLLIPVVIVTVRNGLVGGDFVLIASQGGINFYIGNNPHSDGMTSSVPEAGGVFWENRHVENIAERALGYPPSPSEVSAYWYARAWAFITAEPVMFLKLLMRKFYLFWSHIEVANNLSFYWFERVSAVLKVLPVGFWFIGPIGLAGVVLARRERRAWPLIIFLLLYCMVTVAFFVTDRFRLPIVPVLCVFAGYATDRLLAGWSSRRWTSLAAVGGLITVGALLVNSNLADLRPDAASGEEALQARAALESRDYERAATLLDRVVSADPENAGAHVNRGIALWMMGKTEEAAHAFRAGTRGDPYIALLNLAHLFYSTHSMDSAILYAQRSVEARPYAPGGYIVVAKIYIVQGNIRKAEEVLRSGLSNCRDNFLYGEYLLAGIFFQNGKLAAADSMYRRVLDQTSRMRQSHYAIESEKAQFGEDLPTLRAKTLHGVGRVFAARQNLDSSEVYLRAAANLLPTRADVWADWGVCLLRLNRLEEADTVLGRAAATGANNPAMWFNYGTVLARKGDWRRAQNALSIALALKPDFEEARRLMNILTGKNSK